jgi:threonine dehydratase
MLPFLWLEQALQRIHPYIATTPLTYDSHNDIYIKWENHQVTGSFKARGALNKILGLADWELERGLVTASAGNHGQGVAMAAKIRQASVIVFASEHAQHNKLEAMHQLGADIHLVAGGYGEAEQAGIDYSKASGATWVSPYNDGMIIAGQGSIAIEALKQVQDSRYLTWIVPAGGGGLVSGIGVALQELNPNFRLVAVQSEASPFLHEIYQNGTQSGVTELASIADGLAGPVEAGSVTIPMVKKYVTDFLLVSEVEISQAIRYAWLTYHEIIEGSAAVSLAAILSGKVKERPALIVISGGNIEPEEHAKIVSEIDQESSQTEK